MSETHPAPSPRAARAWSTSVAVLVCVALECVVASAVALDRAARVTALVGLAAIAVALSLRQALRQSLEGKRAPLTIGAIVVVPMAFCVLATVVLILDAHLRQIVVRR
jgi:hypothetical protein